MMAGHTSLSVIVRPEFRVHTLSHSSEEPAMRVDLPPGSLKNRVPSREIEESLTRKKVPPSSSAAGFLLMDSLLNPISYNAEAIQILGYPDKVSKPRRAQLFLPGRHQYTHLSAHPVGHGPFVT